MEFNIIYLVTVLVVILLSMTLHEAMHAFMGYWLGDTTAKDSGRLTLNPLKHIDPFMTILLPLTLAVLHLPIFGGAKPVPFNPNRVKGGEWGAALVAIVGPLTNFFLAFIAFGIYSLLGSPAAPSGVDMVLSVIIMVNLGFFVFNILPIPPLDGSRLLYALAPDFVRRAMDWIERYGVTLVFVIILVASPLISTVMGAMINFFLALFTTIFHQI